jgi:formate--tetrahydrofolate ligase
MGLSMSDYVVTEAGFASELGAEKFFNIKSQIGKLKTNAVVIVATIRALKYHGGVKISELAKENLDALRLGFENLDKHVENMHYYGFRPVVAINRFNTDTDAEIELVQKYCEDHNVRVSVNTAWAEGGKGAVELAKAVLEAAEACSDCFTPLYDLSWTIEKKIETITTLMYGAKNVEYTLEAKEQLKKIAELGLDNLAVCIAKTQKSLSDDQARRNRPRDFTVRIRKVELSSGAGFVVPIAGAIMRMPGLPAVPSAEKIDIDENGQISGLF